MPPPLEQPEAYTRLESMQASVWSCLMMALTNPTSSTFWVWAVLQQRPIFHELPTPLGNTVMKPLLSPRVAQPDRPF
jgi:hypothetical protein